MNDAYDADDEDSPSGLVGDILAHPGSMEMFRDDAFAGAFNEYLRNASFRKDGTEDPGWSASFRAIGDILGQIRGLGEPYIVFYLHSPPFTEEDTARVEAFLTSIGWHRMSKEEVATDHAKALALLEEVEARATGTVPVDQRIGLVTDRDKVARPESAAGRMHLADFDGKATIEEHHRFFSLYDFDLDRAIQETAEQHAGPTI